MARKLLLPITILCATSTFAFTAVNPADFNRGPRRWWGGGKLRSSQNDTAEFSLRSYLMSNYRMVRPVRDARESVLVQTRLFPIKIQELVEKEERLVLTVRVQLGWADPSMSWKPAAFQNLSSVVFPYNVQVWLPELQIVNSAMDMYGIFALRSRRSPVKAHSNGEVWWHPTGRMDVRCELQLMYFPFDFQRCGITLEPVIYTHDQLNLTLRAGRHPVKLSMYSENGLWKLVKTGGTQEIIWVSKTTGFSRVEFVMYLQRRTTYYKMNIIFPCILLSILQLLTFILPIDNDERVPQATTILLSVIVFQTVIVDQLPKSSTSMSLLAMYISTLVGISTATVASSIVCALFISLRPSCFQVPVCFEAIAQRCVTKVPHNFDPSLQTRSSRNARRRQSTAANMAWSKRPTVSMDKFPKSQLIHQRSLELNNNASTEVWKPGNTRSLVYRPHTTITDDEATSSRLQTPNRATAQNSSVFSFHTRSDFHNRMSSLRRNRWPTGRSEATPLAADYPVDSGTVTAQGEANWARVNRLRPPYVLVVDWCRMSHIINASMFTLCLCLDILVPSVLFYIMPPINPPT